MIRLFAHPFSSRCWKAMIACHEKEVAYDLAMLDRDHPDNGAAFARRWPMRMMPLLVDDDGTGNGDGQMMESSVIIEWLDRRHPQPRLIPDGDAALAVRMMDRVFDTCVMAPMIVPVFDALRPAVSRDPCGVARARERARAAHAWLDERPRGRTWPRARPSPSPTAPPRRRSSTPTGSSASPTGRSPARPSRPPARPPLGRAVGRDGPSLSPRLPARPPDRD